MTAYVRRACTHYTAPGTVCHAGIAVDDKRDADGRFPCVEIRGITGALPCDRRTMPPLPAHHAAGSMTKALEALAGGRCPKCNEDIRGELELDGSVLAMPCRHVLRSTRKD